MKINRRDFGKWLSLAGITLALPFSLKANEKEVKIESVSIDTNFTFSDMFVYRQAEVWPEPIVIVRLRIYYEDGAIKEFESDNKQWSRRKISLKDNDKDSTKFESNGRKIYDLSWCRLSKDEKMFEACLGDYIVTLNNLKKKESST